MFLQYKKYLVLFSLMALAPNAFAQEDVEDVEVTMKKVSVSSQTQTPTPTPKSLEQKNLGQRVEDEIQKQKVSDELKLDLSVKPSNQATNTEQVQPSSKTPSPVLAPTDKNNKNTTDNIAEVKTVKTLKVLEVEEVDEIEKVEETAEVMPEVSDETKDSSVLWAPQGSASTSISTYQPTDDSLKRFSLRGVLGYGTYTTIADINSDYSLGFSFGFDINDRLTLEAQYIFTDFVDNYIYSYYGSDNQFNQTDFAAIMNYKILPQGFFQIMLRGGLNYSYRTARDSYWGFSTNSENLLLLLGVAADIRLTPNMYLTGNMDYYLSLTGTHRNSGYYTPNVLHLVNGQNYTNFSVGVKFKL